MKKYKDLSKETELELIKKIQNSKPNDIFFEELLLYFEEKIILYINKYKKIYSEDDIRSTYIRVFWQCVKKFDIRRNNRLNTFIEKYFIYELAKDCNSDDSSEPKNKLIREMQSIIKNSTNSNLPDIEIADKMGLPLWKIIELKNSLNISHEQSIVESHKITINKDMEYMIAKLSPVELSKYIRTYNNQDDNFINLENLLLEKLGWKKEKLHDVIDYHLSQIG